jgi:hypothetical protein
VSPRVALDTVEKREIFHCWELNPGHPVAHRHTDSLPITILHAALELPLVLVTKGSTFETKIKDFSDWKKNENA